MRTVRRVVDFSYNLGRRPLFWLTRKDPEVAHELFITFSRALCGVGLDKFFLEDSEKNRTFPVFNISNAAGMNKDGNIPPRFLKSLGFDRAVIGTVTYDPTEGNERPRTWRYAKTGSLVNYWGLPGIGAAAVRKNLDSYGASPLPLTISIMETPGKKGEDALDDLAASATEFADFLDADRVELNVSCPNVAHGESVGREARGEYQRELDAKLRTIEVCISPRQEIYVKVSPDLDEDSVRDTIEVANSHRVAGFVTTNTTTYHDPGYIYTSPKRGGASGNAVYFRTQKIFSAFRTKIGEVGEKDYKLIACGGIDSHRKAKAYDSHGANQIQIFTPLIFKGPGLFRELREG